MSAVLLACRVLIVLVLAASLVSKARDPRGFVAAVADFDLFPAAWSTPAACLVALIELSCIVLVIHPATTTVGFLICALLLVVFAAVVARILRRGVAVDCHCFGASSPSTRWTPVARNAVLVGLCLLGVASSSGDALPPLPGLTAFGAVVIAVVTASLVLRSEDLVDVLAPRAAVRP